MINKKIKTKQYIFKVVEEEDQLGLKCFIIACLYIEKIMNNYPGIVLPYKGLSIL